MLTPGRSFYVKFRKIISRLLIPAFFFIYLTGFMEIPSQKENPGNISFSQEEVNKIYEKVLENFEKMDTFRTLNYNFIRGKYYRLKPVNETVISITTLLLTFKKPRRLLMDFVDSKDNPNINNTRLYYDGGKKVKIKVPGILGLFTFTFPVNKAELTNPRGKSIEDIDVIALMQRLDDEAARVKFIGLGNVFDQEVYLLEISNIRKLDRKITREIIGVTKAEKYMILHEMYEGDLLVYQDKFKNFTFNVPLTENDFKL
jgi:hypothetical protein